MVQYLFILGNASSLAKAELFSLLKKFKVNYSVLNEISELALIDFDDEIDVKALMRLSGGLIKIAKVIGMVSDGQLVAKLTDELTGNNGHVTFGISLYGTNINVSPEQISKNVKMNLKNKGISCRFILPKNNRLSSVVVTKQKLDEFIIFAADKLYLAKTSAVQDFEDWSNRDYGRPSALPKTGMLPPKVARMMVNLISGNKAGDKLLDPFCGTGTVIQEAMAVGFNCTGSDISAEVLSAAGKNLDWFKTYYKLTAEYTLYNSDATKLTHIKDQTVDHIVTEPYLGPVWELDADVNHNSFHNKSKKLNAAYLNSIISGLEGLYTGTLRELYRVLKKNGELIIAVPSFYFENKEYFVKKVVDNFSRLGYIIRAGPLPYFRPQAVVRRNIYVLIKD